MWAIGICYVSAIMKVALVKIDFICSNRVSIDRARYTWPHPTSKTYPYVGAVLKGEVERGREKVSLAFERTKFRGYSVHSTNSHSLGFHSLFLDHILYFSVLY